MDPRPSGWKDVGSVPVRPEDLPSSLLQRVTLRPDPSAVSEARRFVARLCATAGLAPDLCDTAVLLTSETVTNAVLHGGSPARLSVTALPTGVRVEVGDDNNREPLLHADQNLDALGGRGMFLVDVWATAWGVRPDRVGKLVWFEVGTL